ncbi:MAG: hypothetical protein JWO84_776 [Parcubacteria group bacterium]|nr:hypothetical protein [Parcubacteria group bacterium]
MKAFTPARLILLFFTAVYIVAAIIYVTKEGRFEFLIYAGIFALLFLAAFYIAVKYELPIWMLWLLSILGALHLAGGWVMVKGDVLYNLVLIPIPNWTGLTIWKYDQLVHPYGAAAVALISYALLARTTPLTRTFLFAAAFMIGNGAGALNEVVEFITKITVPHTDVGGYYNTALDLFFNMLGSIIGAALGLLIIRRKS